METNLIYNEDCLKTMEEHIEKNSIDIVLTSPPYCTSNRGGKKSTANLKTETHSNPKYYPSTRYDIFSDNLTPDEYIDWTVKLFSNFDSILKENGCILYNISYSSTRRDMLFSTIAAIVERTNFSIMDMIVWKKKSALPNNTSSNKLTRIVEPVFVFARKSESDTFICNKKVMSIREKTGQKMYENVFNFIEAANNDGANSLNKATYSSELCEKLLSLYGKNGMIVYDPFMGTGTTAVACKRLGMQYIGSELSEEQTKFANKRIEEDDGKPRVYDSPKIDDCKIERKPRKCRVKNGLPSVEQYVKDSEQQLNLKSQIHFEQLELFDENGEPNPVIFRKPKITEFCEKKDETDFAFSTKPMSAAEIEIEDEFSEVDIQTMEKSSNKTPFVDMMKEKMDETYGVEEDEFE